ncbi:MAG: Xaa-Pro dipeptidyl-peptidase [Lactobacillus sp.]|nr:Xaa-Pro dipeptidyl-peptidase [Lactobacillus sp.]
MRYNQFAYINTALPQAIKELSTINFLPDNYEELTFSELLKEFVLKTFPENPVNSKLAELAVGDVDLLTFLDQKPEKMTGLAFKTMALNLLGYELLNDYKLDDVTSFWKKHALPEFTDLSTKDELIMAFYRLLNTRAKNGQLLIDGLAAKGYFKSFFGGNSHVFFNGKSLPVFDTSRIIREMVYVETDLDTDGDGKSDLIQVAVYRPSESELFKIPAIYTANPYFTGIVENAKTNHNVDEDLVDATTWTNPQYEAKAEVPAKKPSGEDFGATEEAFGQSSYTLNEYMLARGFASVTAAAIGTRHSDGLRITGAPEETIAAKAVIEWLHGDRIAYTDRERTHEVKASWCTGNVGMSGRSYLGTLQISLATTGVPGLKTVVSEAAISSWYDYYREHGLVVAPEACQGEDLDKLAEFCQSNLLDAGDYLKKKAAFEAEQKELNEKQDRATGQYSDFWEARNYRHHTDGIKCSFISVHGLNDWNVKPKNVYKLWQKIKHLPIRHHLFLHQGPHHDMNNLVSIDFTDILNMWYCQELLDLNNGFEKQISPVMIQDNLQADEWHLEDDWSNHLGSEVKYYAEDQHTLSKNGNFQETVEFVDQGGQKISDKDWELKLFKAEIPSVFLKTDEFAHPITLTGRPEIKVRVASSKNVGQLSVALVELGKRQHLTPLPKKFMRQNLGYRFGYDALQEFVNDNPTIGKLISVAHMNLQNYQDMKKPSKITAGEFYDLTFQLQPTYYQVPAGSQLALVIYSTDQKMTKRPISETTYQIDLSATELTLYEK